MNQKIEKVKTHFKENKNTYIAGGVCFVVGAVTVLVFKKSVDVKVAQKATNAALVNWKPTILQEQTVIIDLPARGHRGYALYDTLTGGGYGSIRQAAKELGVSPVAVSDHLKGLSDDIHGHKLVNLGENLSEQIKISA
jgi:hypothetical protein